MKINKEKILNITKIIALALVISFGASVTFAAWQNPPSDGTVPTNCNAHPEIVGCNPPVNVSTLDQRKTGGLEVGWLDAIVDLKVSGSDNTYGGDGSAGNPFLPGGLKLGVSGNIGADKYCDKSGNNCVTTLGGGNLPTCTDGQIIQWDATLSVWECTGDDDNWRPDDDDWQTRVTGTCASGSSIRVINKDGTVSCETDDTSSAGGGVTKIIAGSNVAINPTAGTGEVTINAVGGFQAKETSSCTDTNASDASVATCKVSDLTDLTSIKFCALSQSSGSRGSCRVYKDGSDWKISANSTSIDGVPMTCRATCFKF